MPVMWKMYRFVGPAPTHLKQKFSPLQSIYTVFERVLVMRKCHSKVSKIAFVMSIRTKRSEMRGLLRP